MSQVFTALSMLLLTPRLFVHLGEKEFGQYGVLLSAIAIGGIIDFGMNMGMLRRTIRENEKTSALFSSMVLTYLLFLVGLSLLVWVAVALGWGFSHGFEPIQLQILVLLVVQTLMSGLLDVMIQSSQKIFKAKLIRITKTIIEFCLIWWQLNHITVTGILLIMASVNLIYLLVLFVYASKETAFKFSLKTVSFNLLSNHLRYSFWYFLTALSAALVFHAQVFVIDRLGGTMLLASFILFSKFFEIIRTSVSNFTIVLFPTIVTQERDQDKAAILKLFKSAMSRVLVVLFFMLVLLVLFGKDLFVWWTKQQQVYQHSTFLLFLFFTLLMLLDNVSVLFLSALRLNRNSTLVSLLQGVLGLVLSALTIQSFGLEGVLWSSIAALVCTSLFYNIYHLFSHLKR